MGKYKVGMVIRYYSTPLRRFKYCKIRRISTIVDRIRLWGYFVYNLGSIDETDGIMGYVVPGEIEITIIGSNPNSKIVVL